MSRKLEQDLIKPREVKPSIVNQQCDVYHFSWDLCDEDYMCYTTEHKYLAIGKHFLEAHDSNQLLNESHFNILRKCLSKFDCLSYELLYIKKLQPTLNTQVDSLFLVF